MVLPRQPAAAAPLSVPIWAWFAGGAVLLLALAALLLRRRGPRDEELAEDDAPAADEDTPAPDVAPAATAAARLAIELRPTRAGVNLLTTLVEAEVIVTNIGDDDAADIRAGVALLGASGETDAALDALAGRPVGQPTVPPFALAPGEERRFRAIAALPPLDAIRPLEVGGRPMFVPLVAVTAQWTVGAARRGVTRGFAVGVERVDSAKLAPLWLDVPPRSYDSVAARPHGEARER